jgi:protein-tyrosine phosphatase
MLSTHVYQMRAQVYWIDGPWPGRLAIVARPRGGDWLDDEARAWKTAGLDVVVSLLMPDETTEFDLLNEAGACEAQGIRFFSFGIPDRGVPDSRRDATELIKRICELLAAGRNAAVHCRQGIGRSGLMAGCLLVLGGFTPVDASARISRVRGCEVPETPEQKKWIADFTNLERPASPTERVARGTRP